MSRTHDLKATEQSLATVFDVALLDLDGVLYRGPEPVDYAASALESAQRQGMAAFYVTNNASRTPQMVADHLVELGIAAESEQIITAAQAGAQLVLDTVGKQARVLAIGGTGLRVALDALGLTTVTSADDAPDVVVQGFDKQLGWADLAEATFAIKRGAQYIATNLDSTLPTERGTTLGNGSLIAAVVHATGVTPRSAGKPAPGIFEQAQRRSNAKRPLVVGDRLDTDLAGARAAGFAGLHVLTGVDGPAELLRASAGERPTYLGADLRTLAETHPAVSTAPSGEVQCRAARARATSGTVTVLRADTEFDLAQRVSIRISMDELRAACVAAWHASDAAGVDTILPTQGGDLTVSCD